MIFFMFGLIFLFNENMDIGFSFLVLRTGCSRSKILF
jgi:hypothetical protein